MSCPAWVDAKFRAHVLLWAVLSAMAYGLVAAIIPNPVFGRSVPPTDASIAIWLLSAPLMGIIGATYSSPWAAATSPIILLGADGAAIARRGASSPSGPRLDDDRAGWLGGVASFGAFLAIGCPVCNKLALVLLGTSGALSVWAPIQPVLGAISLGLLLATVVWRLRLRASGATCAV
jgi:hypothetical protein